MSNLSEADRQFLSALHALMREYDISRPQLLQILGWNLSRRTLTGPLPRPLKTYRNPHTGVCIQVRAGRSLTYRAWVAEYGEDAVAGWLVEPIKSSADLRDALN